MMKKINPQVLINQNNYNEAFEQWKNKGFPVPSQEYQVIFNCIYEASKGVIRGGVKHYDDEADDKAIELTLKIMQRDEIGKHYKIDSLGAYLGVCKLEFTVSAKVQEIDKTQSYEVMLENGYDKPQEENKEDIIDLTYYQIDHNDCPKYLTPEDEENNIVNPAYDANNIKNYKISDIQNPDTLFEILFRLK